MQSRYLLAVCALLWSISGAFAQGPVCGAATEFCAENGLSFPASTNLPDAPPGNDYGCLLSTPNPAWYYMSTTGPGVANIQLQSAPAVDIDFALWGPFTSLGDALSNCGSLGSPVSCSYSTAAFETVTVPSGGAGEFFILLITNFSNQPTDITGSTTSQILGCNVCIAEGGTLTPQDQVGCVSNLEDITVEFGGFNPDPATFGYTMVVTDPSGVVTSEFPFQTTLSPAFLGPGSYTICGIGYQLGSGEPASFVGQNLNTLTTDLMGPSPPFCGDVSDNCVNLTVVADPIPQFVVDSVCIGAEEPNCPFINGEYICDPGAGSFTLQNQFGCDSLISYLITPRNSVIVTDSVQLCPGEPFEYDGTEYFAPNLVTVQIPAGPAGGCDTTLFLLLQSEPLLAFITPPSFLLDCNTPSIQLESTGSSTGADITYVWSQAGTFISTGTSITVTEAGTYTLTVTRTNPATGASCSASVDATIVQDAGESGAPAIAGPATLCAGDAGTFAASFGGSFGPYTYDWTTTGPTSVLSQTNDELQVSWAGAGTYQVCVTANGSCGPSDETCVSVTVENAITATATADALVCGFSTPLSATPSGGTWTAVAGPSGTGTLADPGSANTTASVASAGTYTFEYGVPGDCNTPASVTVTFGEDLSASAPVESCDPATLNYTVSFTIAGGTAPFVVTGSPGTLAGDVFTSDPLASGDPYDVLIVDAAGCVIQVVGSANCSCTTDAGAMSQTLREVCAPDDITVDFVTGSVNDGDDVGVYVLHDLPGAVLGTVFQTSTTGRFQFQSPLEANVTYFVSYVTGNDDGSGAPDPSDPCYDVSQGQPVRWLEPTPADAGADDLTCGLTIDLQAGGTPGQWTTPAGITVSDPTSPTAVATAAGPGVYVLTWTTGTATCADADEVTLTFAPAPTAAASFSCAPGASFYDLDIAAGGGTGPYTVQAAFVVSGASPNFTASLPVGVTYSFTVVDANGCESQVYTGTPDCDCLSGAGSVPTDLLEACIGEAIQAGPVAGAQLDPDDVGVYVLHDGAGMALGTAFAQNATGVFTFAAPLLAGTTYFVSYVVGNDDGTGNPDLSDPCLAVSAGQPVRWLAPETADAGPDLGTCGLEQPLRAGNAAGAWSGPAGITFADATDPATTARASAPGTYTLTWTTGTGTCTDADEVEVTYFAAPTASAAPDCDPGATLYTLTITASGGSAPYTVDGLAVSGAGPVFTTMLPSGLTYAFTIVDANGCRSQTVTGSFDCDCETVAPAFGDGAEACVGDAITLGPATGGFDDGDDADRYVLYEGDPDAVATVLARSATPSFAYDASYVPGVTYYVAVERANADGAGGIDEADPCLDRSLGVPVSWTPLPTITLADATVCAGDDAAIAYDYVGELPAQLTLLADGQTSTVTLTQATGTITLPGTAGEVVVTQLAEDAGCTNDAPAAVAEISVQTPVAPVLARDLSLCNSAASGDPTDVETATLLVSGGSGTWTSPDAPAALSGGTFSALGLAPGTYALTYTTTPVGTCPATSASLRVTVRDCACPNLTLLQPGVLCNDDAFLDLATLLEEPQVGTWSLIGVPAGTQPALLAGSTFDGSGADAGTYRVRFTLTAGQVAGCPDTNSVAIRLAGQVFAGVSTGDLEFCESEGGVVDLGSQLTGQSSGGTWASVNAGTALSGSFVDVGALAAGTYTFEYEVSAPPPCDPARASVVIVVTPAPTAEAGQDRTLTCVDRSASLGVSPTSGVAYSWTAEGDLTELSDESTLTVELTGLYVLTVTDLASGCTARDEVEVVATDEVPVVEVELQPLSCNGELDGAINITTIDGGQGPYRVTLNGENVGAQRTFFELGPGDYALEITDANGCTADPLAFELEEPEELSAEILTNLGGTGIGGGTIQFRDTVLLEAVVNSDSASVRWSPSEYVACDTCAVTYGLPPSTLVYAVSVTTPEGCQDEASVQVIVRRERPVYFPTGFTPNGDQVNDYFFPQAPEGVVSSIRSFIIADRWGERVFERYNFDPNERLLGFDGSFLGEPLNPQVLVYVAEVEFADGVVELFEGDITLVR